MKLKLLGASMRLKHMGNASSFQSLLVVLHSFKLNGLIVWETPQILRQFNHCGKLTKFFLRVNMGNTPTLPASFQNSVYLVEERHSECSS